MEKICILKCKEKDLLHNVKVLCTENLEYLPGFPGLFCKGNRFYFILKNYEDLKDIDIRGKIIK